VLTTGVSFAPVPRRIVTISSAPGWAAELDVDEGGAGRRVTLAGWALVEDEELGAREVVGLVLLPRSDSDPTGRVGLVDEVPGFGGYAFAGVRTRPADM
jgi:hypothetical protein